MSGLFCTTGATDVAVCSLCQAGTYLSLTGAHHMKNVKGTTRYKGLHHMDTELYEYGSLQRRPIQILYFDYGRRQRCSELYRLCDRDIFHLVR